MGLMPTFDVLLSYALADRDRVLELRDALVARGLRVRLGDAEVESFASISTVIDAGLARSKACVAFYSATYPTSRACQSELTAALLAAYNSGTDPRTRLLIVNPEDGAEHIEPIELQDVLFASAPAVGNTSGLEALVERIATRVGAIDGELGELGVAARPAWMGRRPVGAARFVGRVRDMWRVHSALTAGSVGLIAGAHTSDPMVMVTGMGGVGKSLLAQEYALRFAAGYPGGVFWLRAHGHDDRSEDMSREAPDVGRDAQLLAFARELGRPSDGLVLEQLPRVLAEELDRRRQPFLWVVDDLPPGLSSQQLEAWCAPGRHGRTLLTTRSREYHRISKQIDLGVLSPEEGYELLVAYRVPDSAEDERAARELVEDLGAHALALDVTGAALRAERGVRSFAQYRAALANRSHDELAIVTTTLGRSISWLDEPARDFLRLASRLAAEPILATLAVAVLGHAEGLDLNAARERAVAGMRQAAAGSLADDAADGRAQRDGTARRVHPLVSRTVALLEPKCARTAVLTDSAFAMLTFLLREAVSRRYPVDAQTLAHARHLTTELIKPGHVALLEALAIYDLWQGNRSLACEQMTRVADARQRLLGDDHPDTVTSMNNAATFRSLGNDAGTAPPVDHGAEHPAVAPELANLDSRPQGREELEAARAALQRELALREEAYGPTHPEVAITLGDLGVVQRRLGQFGSAHSSHHASWRSRRPRTDATMPTSQSRSATSASCKPSWGNLREHALPSDAHWRSRKQSMGPSTQPSPIRLAISATWSGSWGSSTRRTRPSCVRWRSRRRRTDATTPTSRALSSA